MASVIHTPGLTRALTGFVDFDTDSFKVMLSTSAYTPEKDHNFRDDVTPEISGTGYVAGGEAVTVSVTEDLTNDRVDITLGGATWPGATFTARNATYYKARGGAASVDEIIATNDFGSDKSPSGGSLTLAASTLRIQN